MGRFFIAGILLFAVLGTASVASADSLGQVERFSVNTQYDVEGEDSISATLREIGANAYWYVDDRYWHSLRPSERTRFATNLESLVGLFDATIYPKSRELFGSEPIPGVDGDPRVTVLLEELTERSGGYYETKHYYATSVLEDSNEREMIFVNATSVLDDRAAPFVAHELQHLISFNQKELRQRTGDDTWLNEARSEYAVTAVGLNVPYVGSVLQSRASSFIRAGSDSLVEWPNTSVDYAVASLFAHYVAEQYGADAVAGTVRVPQAGVAALAQTLSTESGGRRFWQVFSDWMVAASVNDRRAGERFGYRADGLDTIHVTPERDVRLRSGTTFTADETLDEWQPLWYEFSVPSGTGGSRSVSVTVDGANGTTWAASVTGRYADGSYAVFQPSFRASAADVAVPLTEGTAPLVKVYAAVAQGAETALGGRSPVHRRMTLTVALGDEPAGAAEAVSVAGPEQLTNGDLVSYPGAPNDTYVIWEGYRRYLPPGVLALYGFEHRPVHTVSRETFFGYDVSNYIRTEADERVYAVRPEGTRHWLNMSEAQFLGSGRDPAAIFTVNEAEAAFYVTGEGVTR